MTHDPASMAGEPEESAIVFVVPPLLTNTPSRGSVFCKSPVPVNPQEVALSRLYPLEVMVPPQSEPEVWLATMLLVTVAGALKVVDSAQAPI